jgi:hypothetical protein
MTNPYKANGKLHAKNIHVTKDWADVNTERTFFRSSLFWDISRRRSVNSYGRFGTAFQSHFESQAVEEELFLDRSTLEV